MRVLITGAGGQVGRSLRLSADSGAEVIALDRAALDIADERLVLEVVRRLEPRLIVNCAAYTKVDRAESEPEAAQAVNATGARNVALAAREVGARLLHFSTDLVFDGESDEPYRPTDPPRPLSVYGSSKLAGEMEVEAVCGDSAVIIRISRVYSEFGSNFVKTMLRLIDERATIRVVDDQIGSFTWAGGLADAVWEISSGPGTSGILHWSDGGTASWHEFAGAIQEIALEVGLLSSAVEIEAIPTEAYPLPATRPRFSALDSTATQDLLDSRQLHWKTALRRMLEAAAGRRNA